MARKTQLDRAIEGINAEIAALVHARERLEKQREEVANRKAAALESEAQSR